jgi:hypothetical protein
VGWTYRSNEKSRNPLEFYEETLENRSLERRRKKREDNITTELYGVSCEDGRKIVIWY